MELLKKPHWNIMDSHREEMLKKISVLLRTETFYLGGGTALSLQMGLRKSFDFDFFTPDFFDSNGLYARLKDVFPTADIDVVNLSKDTCDLRIDSVQVSFFRYPYKLVDSLVEVPGTMGLRLASPKDIAAMKVSAIGGRGAKKDFYDLYNIMRMKKISVEELAKCVVEKFGEEHNYAHMCMGLSYFADAEGEKLPTTFVKCDWNDIKKYFTSIQNRFEKDIERCISDKENEIQMSLHIEDGIQTDLTDGAAKTSDAEKSGKDEQNPNLD